MRLPLSSREPRCRRAFMFALPALVGTLLSCLLLELGSIALHDLSSGIRRFVYRRGERRAEFRTNEAHGLNFMDVGNI